jgi:hypothetical protein
MGDIDTAVPQRHSLGRRVAGWTAATLAGVVAVLSVLGAWNPTELVVLWRLFSNPMRGGVLFFGLAFAASWLLAPVRSEASQASRMRWRITFGIGLVASLIAYGLFGPLFTTKYREMASSGERTIVLYDPGTDIQHLHVWAGKGLGARHMGDLGKPCGPTKVTFTAPDRIRVATSYGTFDLRLDPDTGKPLDHLGPTCSG